MTQNKTNPRCFDPYTSYVLTSGSTGDGDLPVRLQEYAVPVPYPLGKESLLKENKTN
jgi:hypothetical protein